MGKKKSKPEIIITQSGHEADRDLARVPIKVSPALQALVANQLEIIEMAEGKTPRNPVFIEQHKLELLQVEEEIAGAFAGHMQKKERARQKRMMKNAPPQEKQLAEPSSDTDVPGTGLERVPEESNKDGVWFNGPETAPAARDDKDWGDVPFDLAPSGGEGEALPTGLPSSRYEERRPATTTADREPDVRRIALGASIRALQNFLGRELTEAEMQAIEAQVDSYLG